MYENYAKVRDSKGLKDLDVSKATGISPGTLSDWKSGRIKNLKAEKLRLIADFLDVSIEYLMTGQHPEQTSDSGRKYYFNDATAAAAQELFEEPGLRLLFDAARGSDPEALKLAADMLRRMKGEK